MARDASRLGLGMLLVALAAACGKDEEVPAPTALAASLVEFDVVFVTWIPPQGAETIDLDMRVESGLWTRVGSGGGFAHESQVRLRPDDPEAATYGFRVRANRHEKPSHWTEVSLFRGVRAAKDLQAAAGSASGPMQLTWTRGSRQADALRLERRVVAFDGTAAAWSALPAPALDATSYADADLASWVDGASLEYRLVYSIGTLDSDAAIARSPQAPRLPRRGRPVSRGASARSAPVCSAGGRRAPRRARR